MTSKIYYVDGPDMITVGGIGPMYRADASSPEDIAAKAVEVDDSIALQLMGKKTITFLCVGAPPAQADAAATSGTTEVY